MVRNCWLAVVAVLVSCSLAGAEQPGRPNVILFFSDDQGTLDLHCYGSSDLYTPHLDALAARGVRFSQFYTAAPVCSPSRAALLTGRYPQRAGVPGNVPSQPGHAGMPTEQVTLAEVLRGGGYRTALFGKWHLGTVPECSPNGQGFDEFFGHHAGCIDNYSHFFYWRGPHFHDLWRNDERVHEDGTHFTNLIVRETNRFLTENRERPFFVYVPINLPHYPLQARAEDRRRYADLSEPRRSYAAAVSTVDDAVGRVLAHLEELDLAQRTLVVFLSDHGHSTEERANFGGGNAGPYRGSKFSVLEGGIRVPCIARLPGVIPAGQVRQQLAVSVDWFPTIAALCRVELPDRKIDGRSLLPVLKSATATASHEQFHWQLGDQWAVRQGDWKLAYHARDTERGKRLTGNDKLFLSNMARDATERNNIAAEHPDVVKRLQALHDAWAAEVK